ncbi:multidrug resistance-associated protein 1-like [Eriocheir sinensis]|uniref:multidrug resistance-associated protein 1-like n=1 Tax=Eriocheir sinensis TaxID=95602 RepID=UPI0021C8867F|nr:multidrug resistance-associated protein 1-like [Eriocheir sinensis]XP_050687070.1 multidrug resistance-associated protein 1-like [Eriocheir sinensis]
MSIQESGASGDAVILLPRLCDVPLWNASAVWHSEAPRFGRCAERTVLLWVPCLMLWVTAPFYAFLLKRRPYDPIPWSALAYVKVMVTGLLLVAAAAEGVWAVVGGYGTVTPADILAPPLLLVTYTLHLSLLLAGRRHGKRSSAVLGVYWLVTLMAGTPQLITAITTTVHQDGQLPPMLVATTITQYLGALVLFVASCVNDVPSGLQKLTRTENPNPELDASFLNRLLFVYAFPIIWRGWRQPLTPEDLPDAQPVNSARVVYSKWRRGLDGRKERHTGQNVKFGDDGPTVSAKTEAKVSLVRSIWQQNQSSMVLNLLQCFTLEAITFFNPLLVGWLITFLETPGEPTWHGYLYAMCLLAVGMTRSFIKNTYFKHVFTISIRIRTALMAAVYNKALHLSSASRRDYTVGKIVNLMAVDTQTIGDVYLHLYYIIVAPFTIITCLAYIWTQLGPSALAGLIVMGLLVPFNSFLLSRSKKINVKVMAIADTRVKAISEIISGIKVLKLYAWETSFTDNVKHTRKKELRLLKELSILRSFNLFLFTTTPFLVALATFTCYLLVSEENTLDPQKTFICLTLFDLLKLPVLQLPEIISNFISGTVSLRRIETYLNVDELDPLAVTASPGEDVAVKVEGGCFVWEGDEEQASWRLEDIKLSIPHGRLVALVGTVGAGKSSILSALLGEMKKDAGRVVVNGSVAYVPQIPWVQNATLRDNITWGQPYDPKRYRKVVRACALLQDFDMLPAGDMTEIGENGINISGGQKQRVSLARAVYSDASIFLLDDPLSAVDAHVGRHIFDYVVGPNGMLRNKTRVLVTHAVTFLPQVDEVAVVAEGRLRERGSYTALLADGGDFANFVVQHIKDLEEDAEEELEVICQQLEGLGSRGSLYRQISETRQSMKSMGSTTKEQGAMEVNLNHSHFQSNPIPPKRLSHSRGSVDSRHSNSQALPRLQHQLSTTSDSRVTNGSSTCLNGSTSSLNRHAAEDKHELEPLAGSVKGQTLVQEETSEVGSVSHHVYSVYGRAMGLLPTIAAIVCMALAQTSSAGSSVWLAHWTSSQQPPLTDTTSLRDSTNFTDGINLTDSTSLTKHANLEYSTNLTDLISSADTVNITDITYLDGRNLTGSTGFTESKPVDRDVFLAVYGVLAISQSLLLLLGILLMMVGSIRAANSLHARLLSSVIHFPMSFFDTNPSGRIINRFGKEIDKLDKNLPRVLRSFLMTLSQVLTTLVVIITATPSITYFIVPTMVVYIAIQQLFVAAARQVQRLESVSKSPIYSHFSESINGVSVVRAFKRQNEFFSQSLQKIEFSLRSIFTNITINRWLSLHLEGLGNLVTFATALFGVINQETVSPGAVGLSITYALSVTLLFNWLVRTVSDLEASIVSVEKIYEYIQMPQEAAWRVKTNVPPPAWPEEGAVEFKNYETRYRPGLSLALRNITCFIRPAEKVGIVGRTGAGKSSLTMALFRIIEASGGRIDIDKKTIATIGLHDLRGQISIIPQDAVLFSGTLRMNLDPLSHHSDADLWRALELAHLSAYIRRQMLGLQHPVDQGGSNFSAGQRQLVCLARALLRHSQVLVLDEATAAVDLETDDLIQATIRTQFAECTVITIAHRLNTIMDSDRVMVLEAGRIAEFDAPATLLQQPSSIFYSMAKDAGIV